FRDNPGVDSPRLPRDRAARPAVAQADSDCRGDDRRSRTSVAAHRLPTARPSGDDVRGEPLLRRVLLPSARRMANCPRSALERPGTQTTHSGSARFPAVAGRPQEVRQRPRGRGDSGMTDTGFRSGLQLRTAVLILLIVVFNAAGNVFLS